MAGSADDPPPSSPPDGPGRRRRDEWLARARSVGVVRAVLAVVVLAVLARFVLLGARTFHWDEARVGYWILHTLDSGSFAYRRIIHGPFVQHVNHVLFPLFGASDLVARAPVALVGGLLPAAALLFREHLADDETVVLALFLGFEAVLVYYSRFMRSDVLVAAFMFVAFGLLVRFYDTRRARYLYGVGAFVALGVASKENALVYVLTWLGATALLADQALFRPRGHESGTALLRERWRARRGWRPGGDRTRLGAVGRWSGHLIGAAVVFLAISVFMYGPRGAGLAGIHYPPVPASQGGLGFFEALSQPTAFPGYAYDALAHLVAEFGEWIGQSSDPGCNKDNVIDGWLCYLGRYVEVMVSASLVVTAFSVIGFCYERYARPIGRNLVLFAGYAGFVSILGYPLGTDVFGAWLVVHAVVPLSIPAAVGVARIYRWGLEASASRDTVGTTVAAVVLLLLASQVAVANVGSVYTDYGEDSNPLVQYAQPADDLDPVIEALEGAAAENREGPDALLYYGEIGEDRDDHLALVAENPERSEGDLLTRPACAQWFNTLPLPWYFETTGANVTCESEPARLGDRAGSEEPAVILTMAADSIVPAERLRDAGYRNATYRMRSNDYRLTVFVHERIDQGPPERSE